MADAIFTLLRKHEPNAIAVRLNECVITFRELVEQIETCKQALDAMTDGRPIRCGVVAEPTRNFIVTLLALLDARATVLLYPSSAIGESMKLRLSTAIDVLFCERSTALALPLSSQIVSYEQLAHASLKLASQASYPFPAIILPTSGTTGTPKLVVHDWHSFLRHAELSQQHIGYDANVEWYNPLPLHHAGGISVLAKVILTGLTAVLPHSFDVEEVNRFIDTSPKPALSLVPTMLHRLIQLRAARALPTNLQFILLGGDTISSRLTAIDQRILPTYGMTETASQLTTVPPNSPEEIRCSSGIPLPGVKLELRNLVENNGDRTCGELYVRSPALFRGYETLPGILDVPIENEWFATGDFGYIGAQGEWHPTGRTSMKIVSKGENIDCREVENAIASYPGIRAVVVIGLPDEVRGQTVAAMVEGELSPQSKLALQEHVSARLTPLQAPRNWLFTSNIPLLPNGKPDRQSILETFLHHP